MATITTTLYSLRDDVWRAPGRDSISSGDPTPDLGFANTWTDTGALYVENTTNGTFTSSDPVDNGDGTWTGNPIP